MSELNFFPETFKISYEKHDLIECYPDIDYEMLPIKADSGLPLESAKDFYINQLASKKSILKKAKGFKLIAKPISEIPDPIRLHDSEKTEQECIAISKEARLTVLIPLDLIISCKKTKKYTVIFLTKNQALKTAIPFKKLKKRLTKYGFTKITKSHLTRNDELSFHFPKVKLPK